MWEYCATVLNNDSEPNPADSQDEAKPVATLAALDPPKTTVTLGGCLQEAAASKGAARSAPSGGQPQDVVTVKKGDVSIIVNHKLTHNCCFKATVTTKISGPNITILEALAGDVCRCMCDSTITTEIDLHGRKEFKEYKIKVEVDNNGKPGTTHNEVFSLQ